MGCHCSTTDQCYPTCYQLVSFVLVIVHVDCGMESQCGYWTIMSYGNLAGQSKATDKGHIFLLTLVWAIRELLSTVNNVCGRMLTVRDQPTLILLCSDNLGL